MKDIANREIERFGQGLQEACDEVYAGRQGLSVGEIFSALRANIDGRTLSVTLDDEKVRSYAEAIAEGKRVSVKLPDPM